MHWSFVRWGLFCSENLPLGHGVSVFTSLAWLPLRSPGGTLAISFGHLQVAPLSLGALLVFPLSPFLGPKETPFPCCSHCGPGTNNIDVPRELWFSPAASESSLEQESQGIRGNTEV